MNHAVAPSIGMRRTKRIHKNLLFTSFSDFKIEANAPSANAKDTKAMKAQRISTAEGNNGFILEPFRLD